MAESRPIPYVDTTSLFGMQDAGSIHKLDGAVEIQLKIKPNGEFPKGLLIGEVRGVEKSDLVPFQKAIIKPSFNFISVIITIDYPLPLLQKLLQQYYQYFLL